MDGSWCFRLLELLVGKDPLWLLYLPIKAFATTILKFSSDMSSPSFMWDIYEIKKHSQVKVILAFTIESVSSCFLIHYICTIHVIVVKVDDVRTRNIVFWILPYVHQYFSQAHLKILLEMIHSSDRWLVYSDWT